MRIFGLFSRDISRRDSFELLLVSTSLLLLLCIQLTSKTAFAWMYWNFILGSELNPYMFYASFLYTGTKRNRSPIRLRTYNQREQFWLWIFTWHVCVCLRASTNITFDRMALVVLNVYEHFNSSTSIYTCNMLIRIHVRSQHNFFDGSMDERCCQRY